MSDRRLLAVRSLCWWDWTNREVLPGPSSSDQIAEYKKPRTHIFSLRTAFERVSDNTQRTFCSSVLKENFAKGEPEFVAFINFAALNFFGLRNRHLRATPVEQEQSD